MLETPNLIVDFSAISRILSRDSIKNRMQPFVVQAAQSVKGEIASRMPIGATGQASQSVFYKLEDGADYAGVSVYVPPGVPAGAYAWYIEHPRRPGKQPPIDALVPWVKRKLTSELRIAKVASGKIKSKKSAVSVSDSQVRSVAFLIARSIGKKGTYANPSFPPPKPFEKGFEAAIPNAMRILERGQQQLISQLNE